MAQDMVSRIREAERQGEELEREAAARANTRLAQVAEEVSTLRRQAQQESTNAMRDADKKVTAECDRIREAAQREAADTCQTLSERAEKNRARAVKAAAQLIGS